MREVDREDPGLCRDQSSARDRALLCCQLPRSPGQALGYISTLFYTLRTFTFKHLHLMHLNLYKTWERAVRAQLDDPQRGLLPPLSLLTSHFRLLQTIHRPFLQSFHFPPRLVQLFPGRLVATARPLLAVAYEAWCGGGKMCDLESVKVWERFACGYQFRHRRAHKRSRVGYSYRSRGSVGVEWIRVDDGEFSKPWKHGHMYWDWRRSVSFSPLDDLTES